MASAKEEQEVELKSGLSGFLNSLSASKILLLQVGFGLIVIIAIAAFNLSNNPSKALLFSGLDPAEVPAILEVLEANQVLYELQGQDTLLVSSADVNAMRMELATKGMPRGGSIGYNSIAKSGDMYGKTEMEQHVLYKQSTEQEIAMSIEYLDVVKKARVLLAIPKSSRLLKNKGKVKASVAVDTWNSKELSRDQVNGIVKLVVDSVPDLALENVSVVDTYGNQLNKSDNDSFISSKQIDYVAGLESTKSEKITRIIESFVGVGNVKVAVTADVDFSHKEIRQDAYDSENPSIRSRQVATNRQSGISGVPGAVSNMPANAGTAPEKLAASADEPAFLGTSEEITNYEVDKSTLYEVKGKGQLTRLAVSVVVNHRLVQGPSGEDVLQERTLAEIDRIKLMVEAAIGFDQSRGDLLFVSSEPFETLEPTLVTSDEKPDFWERHWFGDALNQLIFLLFFLVIFFGVIKPLIRSGARGMSIDNASALQLAQERERAEREANERAIERTRGLTPRQQYEETKSGIDKIVKEDKKATEQVLKHWQGEDES
ncbi:flagellar basal-body MS-ring/collar protein FliF [Pseudoalteromonas marina]|uniref:Flagellar M-ring protein n=1 Tax=Pseudoalteromonas marina TaxID=267375 RepID=A0ABT9FC25_9GAMM|nr:flagellar basal-body MS-ring/collar protein FliF [Pseudoalteromonas marina]MDP2564338.1 flagellar basal-body MS-ring/collar protein FliF [Pseudoalteromonas marina]